MFKRISMKKVAALVVVVTALGVGGVRAESASAATGYWYSIPSYGSATGHAIIDGYSLGYWSSSARGRVTFNAGGYCRRVQYAPFAYAALDGGWNNLATYCDWSTRTLSWSDTFHASYNGFKFRICGASGCGSVRHIGF